MQKASEANGKLVESVDSTFQPKAKIEMEAENEGENLARSLPADMACNKSSGGFVPHFTPEKPAGESVIITG